MLRLTSVLGLLLMMIVAWAISTDRRRIPWRVIGGGLLLQFAFALLILRTSPGRALFTWAGQLFQATISHADAGSSFLFGISGDPAEGAWPPRLSLLRSVAFGVLPTIVFFSALMSMLY